MSGREYLLCFVDFENVLQSTIALNTLQDYRFDKHDKQGLKISFAKDFKDISKEKPKKYRWSSHIYPSSPSHSPSKLRLNCWTLQTSSKESSDKEPLSFGIPSGFHVGLFVRSAFVSLGTYGSIRLSLLNLNCLVNHLLTLNPIIPMSSCLSPGSF